MDNRGNASEEKFLNNEEIERISGFHWSAESAFLHLVGARNVTLNQKVL